MNSITTPPATRQPGAPWPIDDAAAHLGICSRHLRRLIDDNKIRSIRLGRRIMIPAAELERVANEGA